MTLSQTSNVNNYTGDGNTSSYAFTYPVFLQSHIVVTVVSPSGTSYTLTLGTDFTVAGLVPGGGAASTGTIALVNNAQAWLTGGNLTLNWTISIQRIMPIVQLTSVRNQGNFFPELHENAFDYMTMLMQQVGNQQLILTDIVTGHTYMLVMINGVLSQMQLT